MKATEKGIFLNKKKTVSRFPTGKTKSFSVLFRKSELISHEIRGKGRVYTWRQIRQKPTTTTNELIPFCLSQDEFVVPVPWIPLYESLVWMCQHSLQYTSTLPINYLSSCKVGKHVDAKHMFVVTNSEGVKSSVGPCLRYCVGCKITKFLWFTTAHVWETV